MSLQELSASQRADIAQQLFIIRIHERAGGYTTDRSQEDYDFQLDGYKQTLAYVRRLGSTNTILDIGAGTTKAISEIAKSPAGRGLDFRATVLSHTAEIEKNLGWQNTRITPAEILKDIKDSSVGAALAVYSVTYSVNPNASIDRIDQVLVAGGVFKGRFIDRRRGTDANSAFSTHHLQFEDRLKFLKYDVALGSGGLILAKKPGGRIAISAQDLLEADKYNKLSVSEEDVIRMPQTLKTNGVKIQIQE